MRVVISQPMFLPWIGLFEQIRLADVYVHLDDVKRPGGGSFMTRVQIKTPAGVRWLTAPIDKRRSDWLLSQSFMVRDAGWRRDHLSALRRNYEAAPHVELMLDVADRVYAYGGDDLAGFNRHAIELIAGWLRLDVHFAVASELGIAGGSSQRVVDICRHFAATDYITGHGAADYLDHELFESQDIAVSYIDYALNAYEQQHGDFTPYVSILDTIANIGPRTRELMTSDCVGWRDWLARNSA